MELSNQSENELQEVNKPTTENLSNPQGAKKDVKVMGIEEQATYFKEQFQKTKKLFLHYEKESKNFEAKMKFYQDKLKNYEPKKGDSLKILFKFTYEKEKFYFLESVSNKGEYFFIRQSQMKDIYSEFDPEHADDSIMIYDFERDIKTKEETLQQIILQYDERIKRLNAEIESYAEAVAENKDIKALSIVEVERTRNFFEFGIQEIITSCSDAFTQLKNVKEVEFAGEDLKKEVFSKLSKLIEELKSNEVKIGNNFNSNTSSGKINYSSNLTSIIYGTSSKKWVNEIKIFCCQILKFLMDNQFKFVGLQEEMNEQKIKWQTTLDQIIISQDEELHSSKLSNIKYISEDKIIEETRLMVSSLNSKITNLEQDKYNIAKLKDQQIDILNRENNKRVNINLLKSVLLKIFTTDDVSVSSLNKSRRSKTLFCQ